MRFRCHGEKMERVREKNRLSRERANYQHEVSREFLGNLRVSYTLLSLVKTSYLLRILIVINKYVEIFVIVGIFNSFHYDKGKFLLQSNFKTSFERASLNFVESSEFLQFQKRKATLICRLFSYNVRRSLKNLV